MQTIASMSDRLDMSPEEAVETLRKLEYDVDSVESEISDDQCDILMDVDEDPSTLDALLKEIQEKKEKERKRNERLQAAAKKAAAKKRAAKKKAAAKKKPAAKKKAAAKAKDAEEAETTEEQADTATEEKPAEPVAEVVEVLPPVEEEPAEVKEAETSAETPEAEEGAKSDNGESEPTEAPAASAPVAEILSDDDYPPAEESGEEAGGEAGGEKLSALAAAEKRHEEEERRREEQERKRKERPLAQPDPEVVAEVIRKAEERKRRLAEPAGGPAARRRPGADGPTVMPGPPPEGEEGRRSGPVGKAKVKKKPKRAERARMVEETLRRDAAAMVREFQGGGGGGVGGKRRKRRKQRDAAAAEAAANREPVGGTIEVPDSMTVEQLAVAMDVPVNDLILSLMDDDILATKNQVIELEQIRKLAEQRNFEIRLEIPEEEDIMKEEPDNPEDLELRAPVITVMGHVDHGKTSFLDVVREASVVDGEAGGITQHIAAYEVKIPSGRVVFLDTPGHAAFTEMRARGSQVTDVVVLVVAADDGVKPQTVEAIDHAKAAEVPIVVAVNKIDKEGAEPDRVRQELTQHGLVAEEWGGDTQMQNISCHTKEGVGELLELLGLESQMLELKANPNKPARGAVIESEMTHGLGPTAWVLVQTGTLRVGDPYVCGQIHGRVRSMVNSAGQNVQEAGPSTPVLVTGLSDPASAGDQFIVVKEERIARDVAAKRASVAKRRSGGGTQHMTLEDFHARMAGREKKILNIIVKADVQGSVDVLNSSFAKLGNEEVSVQVVHSGVGGVNESDIMLASASDAVIIGFHVTANAKVQKTAENEGVEIRTYRVIYEAIDEVKSALEGMLAPETREQVVGHAEIRAVFRSSAVGNIAGCYQVDGETNRGDFARLTRDDVVVYEGKIASLRREKDEVKTVATGFECGIVLENFNDIQEGDIIETYRIESIAKKLV